MRGIRYHGFNGEQKYAFMHRHRGPGSWFFVPCIFCMTETPKQILNRLEQQAIQLHPMHLKKEHLKKKENDKGRAVQLKSEPP